MKARRKRTSQTTGAWNLHWATLMVEEFVRCGVRVCCLASGSRSAPLALAAARHKKLTTVVHYDERGGAFYALGVARASGMPALWITTSGSAVANGFPAVVEADAARVPLILITADRPPELRDTGANQTIDQAGIFGRYVRWFVDLPCPTPEIPPAYVLTTVDHAVARARGMPAGPVHVNCMFREPLLPAPDARPIISESLAAWQNADRPYQTGGADGLTGIGPALRDATATLRKARRGLIVVGELTSDADRAAVCALAYKLAWPLLPDITSGLRLGDCDPARVCYADAILADAKQADLLRPDAILHLGGALTSKRLQQFLAAAGAPVYVHVRQDPARLDPEHLVTTRLQAVVGDICRALVSRMPRSAANAWSARWLRANARAERRLDVGLGRIAAICEPAVARSVSRLIPAGHGLYAASSMPIRDFNLFGSTAGPQPRIAANRGASGIDGTVATAVGFADGLQAPVTVVLGDLALLHDLNSLALAARSRVPLTFVVINNNGGGIFSFLPVAQHRDVFETYFGTPHGMNFQNAAFQFGLEYAHPKTQAEFETIYQRATRGKCSGVIEVTTDRNANVRLHAALLAPAQRR